MGQPLAALIRPLTLGLWGAALVLSTLSGRLDLLLRGAFHPLVGICGVALLALALQQWLQPAAGRESVQTQRAWLFSSAMAIAVLLAPPNPSFSDLAASRSEAFNGTSELEFVLPPAQRTLTDWVRLLRSQPDPQLYVGDPVNISGFVYTPNGGRPQLGRLTVRCCLADATPIGLPIRWPEDYKPQRDTWVSIRGQMGVETTTSGSSQSIVLAEEIRAIPRPEQPLEP